MNPHQKKREERAGDGRGLAPLTGPEVCRPTSMSVPGPHKSLQFRALNVHGQKRGNKNVNK